MKKRIGIIALAALLMFGNSGTVFAKENPAPTNELGELYTGQENKYVSEDVLAVGFQATPLNAGLVPEKAALRMVTTVDNLSYKEVGFKIRITDTKGENLRERKVSIHNVYKSLKVAEGSENPGYSKTPKAFHEKSEYFATYTITNIPKAAFRQNYFTVTPYWVTKDGVTVDGVTRSIMLQDAYDGIVSVLVRLNSDMMTAAGSLEVTYPTDILTYKDYFNAGDIYEEMTVDGETSGIVKCVGNVSDISENKKTDGTYVTLRFQVNQDKNAKYLPEAVLEVRNYKFCNNDEAFVTDPVVVQAKYYTFNEKNDDSLRVLSFNLNMSFLREDTADYSSALLPISLNRIQAAEEQILSYEPDLIGLQEDVNNWQDHLTIDQKGYTQYRMTDKMTEWNSEYCSIYVKNGVNVLTSGQKWLTSDGTGSTVALTYKALTDKNGEFYMESTDLWRLKIVNQYSELNNVYHDPLDNNKSYGNKLSAHLMNWVVLERDGKHVIYVNTHLQNRGYNNQSYDEHPLFKLRYFERKAEFQMLQKQITELKKTYPDAAVVITGDLNDTNDSGFYQYVTETYSDSKYVAKNDAGPENTVNSAFHAAEQGQGHDYPNAEKMEVNRIDYCLVSENLKVDTYQVGSCYWILKQAKATGTENVKVYLSDHLPVIVDLHLVKEK